MNRPLIEGSLHEFACKQVDAAMEPLSATEGLNSNIFGKAFVAIIDTFAGIALTFKSNIVNLTKTVKRSELHEFRDSNRLKIKTVGTIDYSRLVGFKVDVPANLNATYMEAIKTVADTYLRLNTNSNAKLMENALTEIFRSLTENTGTSASVIEKYYKMIHASMYVVKPACEKLMQCFNAKFEQQLPFEQVFVSMVEYGQCMDALIDLEPRLQEAREIKTVVENQERILKTICEFGQSNPDNLDKNAMIKLGEMIKEVALIMDGYHLAVMRQLALEHNYVLMTNSIYSKVK